MPAPATSNIISTSTVTPATSWDAAFRATLAVGQTGVIGVNTVGTGINIDLSSPILDSKGNTWTVVPNTHTANGANGNDQVILTCRPSNQIVSGDTVHIPVTGGSFTSVTARGSLIGADMVPVGVATVHPQTAGTGGVKDQTDSCVTTNATQVCWAWNQMFNSGTPGASYTDGHFAASLNTPVRAGSGSFNCATDGYYAPGGAGTQTAICHWGATSSGNSVVVVFDVPTVGNVNIAGQRGATAQGAARLGVHTVTPLSITSVVGQRGATARVAARIGQLAVDIPASPTSVRAFSRLGSLSGTIPLVEPAPQRGATARSFSRKGATSVNTIGNVTVRGQRGAVARSFSRAGVATTNNVDVAGERGATLRVFARLGSRFVSSNSTGEATLRVGPSAEVTIREG